MNYGAIAELNAFYKNKKEEEAINRILANAYESQQAAQPAQEAIPEAGFSPEYVDPIGPTREAVPAREAVEARAGGINIQNALGEMAKAGMGTRAFALQQGMEDRNLKLRGQLPSAVQETQWYTGQNPDLQKTHMALKRAPTVMNLGGNLVVRDPNGGGSESYPVTPKPEQMPEFKKDQAHAVVVGKDAGDQEISLNEMQANLPRLEAVATQLSELGKKATYTMTGQAYDATRREFGLAPRENAIARKEYISKVDNEVLPLLRMTFGAQFTQKEGESLKATLGDTNAAPGEKDAVLRSFIDSKRAEVETQKRKAGVQTKDKKYKLGETITKGGKQYIITKLNSDGNHDVMPVKK